MFEFDEIVSGSVGAFDPRCFRLYNNRSIPINCFHVRVILTLPRKIADAENRKLNTSVFFKMLVTDGLKFNTCLIYPVSSAILWSGHKIYLHICIMSLNKISIKGLHVDHDLKPTQHFVIP